LSVGCTLVLLFGLFTCLTKLCILLFGLQLQRRRLMCPGKRAPSKVLRRYFLLFHWFGLIGHSLVQKRGLIINGCANSLHAVSNFNPEALTIMP
jgi:hypothetical protein